VTPLIAMPASPLLIDPTTPQAELFQYATRRLAAARDLTQSLTCISLHSGDEQDLKAVAEVVSLLLEDGCAVVGVLENRAGCSSYHDGVTPIPS
jgi:hypothetical protein